MVKYKSGKFGDFVQMEMNRMKINTYLIQLAITIIIMFGFTFIIRSFRTGDLLMDQLIGISVGLLLLIFSLIWRRTNKLS